MLVLEVEPGLGLAERQHGLLAREQAVELGWSMRRWRYATERGDWELLTERVARRVGAPETDLQQALAAVLDCGPRTYLSHDSACAHWGVPGFELLPAHVIVVRQGRQTPSPLAIVHRPRLLPEPFGTVLDGIPVVRPALMVLQLCQTTHPKRAERALDTAWSKRLLSGPAVRRELDAVLGRGRPGTVLMRDLLDRRGDDYIPPASGLESRFESVLEDRGIEPLRRQVDSGGATWTGRVDHRDAVLPFIVEIQSDRYHAALVDRQSDAARVAALEAAGFVVEQLSEHQVWRRPAEVVEAVRRGRSAARRLASR